MAKTLKQLSEQQERFNKLWKYASKSTKELAKKVWRMKYKEVHGLCDCGQYSTNTPGGFFLIMQRITLLRLTAGKPRNITKVLDLIKPLPAYLTRLKYFN